MIMAVEYHRGGEKGKKPGAGGARLRRVMNLPILAYASIGDGRGGYQGTRVGRGGRNGSVSTGMLVLRWQRAGNARPLW